MTKSPHPSSVDKGELLPVTTIDDALSAALDELDRECRCAQARGENGKRVGLAVLRKHFGPALLLAQDEFAPLTNSALRAQLDQAHSLPGDVGTGDYVATDPRQMGDGDPYWMIEIQASGGYHSVAEIYSDTAENARAKARSAMAAWSGSGNASARELVAMLNAGDGAKEGTLADLVVQLSAIRTALREAHFALNDSEDLSHLDEPVHAVPLDNVTRLHRALKACERFAGEDEAWEGPGPLVTQIIEQFGHYLTHREALERIAAPLTAMRRDAETIGRRLEGGVAYALSNDPNYLKEIARKALAAHQGAGEP